MFRVGCEEPEGVVGIVYGVPVLIERSFRAYVARLQGRINADILIGLNSPRYLSFPRDW